MRRQSEALLLLPLLPIFLAGLFPMLILVLLGFAGLGLLGILLICAGLSDALDAHSDFNQHIIVEGYAPIRTGDRYVKAAFGGTFGDCHEGCRRRTDRRKYMWPVVFRTIARKACSRHAMTALHAPFTNSSLALFAKI